VALGTLPTSGQVGRVLACRLVAIRISRTAYFVGSMVLAAGYLFLPGQWRRLDLLFASGLCVPVVAIVARQVKPADRLWLLLSGAAVIFSTADGISVSTTVVAPADVLATVLRVASSMLVLAAAVAVVVCSGRAAADVVIDRVILSMAAAGLLWSVGILPRLVATHRGPAAELATFVAVFGLSAVGGALAWSPRPATGPTQPARPRLLLLVALTASLVSATMGLLRYAPTTAVAVTTSLGACTALGLLALDPDAPRLVARVPPPTQSHAVGRLVFRGAALAAIPAMLGLQRFGSPRLGGITLAVVGAAIAILATLCSGRSAAEYARTEQALYHRATHDGLTGLSTRAEFMARLTAELRRPCDCLVIFCDLDGFKTINDRFGHDAGDRLLVEFGRRLRSCVREHDTVARFGGDEFLILHREAGIADATALCERIRLVSAAPVDLGTDSVVIGTSIGAAVGSGPIACPEAYARMLVCHADSEMYAAKRNRALPPSLSDVVTGSTGCRAAGRPTRRPPSGREGPEPPGPS
jgi:diguanylate cyclase (GGDEF)-like protein